MHALETLFCFKTALGALLSILLQILFVNVYSLLLKKLDFRYFKRLVYLFYCVFSAISRLTQFSLNSFNMTTKTIQKILRTHKYIAQFSLNTNAHLIQNDFIFVVIKISFPSISTSLNPYVIGTYPRSHVTPVMLSTYILSNSCMEKTILRSWDISGQAPLIYKVNAQRGA